MRALLSRRKRFDLRTCKGSAGSSSVKKVNWNVQKDCLDDDGRKYKEIVLNNEGNGKTYRAQIEGSA